jgi:hypothetical protein
MKIHEITQGSEEWHQLRAGRFTASSIPDLFMAKSTKGYDDAICSVVEGIIMGKVDGGYLGKWMKRGIELEPMARDVYEIEKLTLVKQCGFIEVDEWTGCSPDGLVGEDGMVQIKCVAFNTQVKYLLKIEKPEDLLRTEKDYYIQMQAEMWMAGRKWNDFFSFHPDLPALTIRVYSNEEVIRRIKEEIEIAKQKVEEIIKKIQTWQEK